MTIMSTEMIETIREYFKTQPVLKAWIFGSYARGEETPESDVDILVVFDRNAKVSLIGHATMMLDLEDLLNRKVDLVKEGTLLPFAVETANRDKVLIYEKSA
jgi:predicted nucleotidyltransferase